MIRVAMVMLFGAAVVCGYSAQRTEMFEVGDEEETLTTYLSDDRLVKLLNKVLDGPHQDAEHVLARIKQMTAHALGDATASCKGTECHVIINVPILNELILSLKYINTTDVLVFSIAKVNKELFRIEVSAKETPKVCVLNHFCGQIKHIYLLNGELCGTVVFNGLPILRDRCLPL